MTIAAIRYNNPGNISLPITGWTGGGQIVGLKDQPGYAEFPTMAIGFQALVFRLGRFINQQSRNTIRSIGAAYAADPNWSGNVSALSGLGLDFPLSTSDQGVMDRLTAAIIRQETGMTIDQLEAQAKPIYDIPGAPPHPVTQGASPATPEAPMNNTSGPTLLSFFGGLGTWAVDATALIEGLAGKSNSELTAVEQAVKANLPLIANSVDGFLRTAENITGIIDPPVRDALIALQGVFDVAVKAIAAGVATLPEPPATGTGPTS